MAGDYRLDGMSFSTAKPGGWLLTATKELRIQSMWPGATTYPDDYLALPLQADVESAIDDLTLQANDILWHDIEHWNSVTDSTKLTTVYQWIYDYAKSVQATCEVGCYGLPFNWNRTDSLKGYGDVDHTVWFESQATYLIPYLDILMPNLYHFGSDSATYESYAAESLRVARAISGGKKVIAFLWWIFHEGSTPYGRDSTIASITTAQPPVITTDNAEPTNGLAGEHVLLGGMNDANYDKKYFQTATNTTTTMELQTVLGVDVDATGYSAYTPTGSETINTLLPQNLFKKAMEVADANSDGFIVWGGGLTQPWVDDLPWYAALQEHLA